MPENGGLFLGWENCSMLQILEAGDSVTEISIPATYEIPFCPVKMVLKDEEDNKSKSLMSRMFGFKEKKTTKTAKYIFASKLPKSELLLKTCAENPEYVSSSETAMATAQNMKTLRAFVATWNVNDQPDIYILGFQEIVPLNAGNVLVLEDSEPAAKWLSLINQSLNKSYTNNNNNNSLRKAASLETKPCSSSAKGSKLMNTPSGSLFFQKHSLKAVSKQFRTESKKKLKKCNCASELERRYKDSCFRSCQQKSNVSECDLSSEEEEVVNGFNILGINSSSNSMNQVKYGLVTSKQMVGIFLTIWAKKELIPHISHMRTSYITRGIMGCLGNKGCISVSLCLYQTSFCFICSHLASGEKEGDELRRNSDVIEILKNTQFPKICKVLNNRVPEKILEHEMTLSYAETRFLLEKNDWNTLLSKDQLKIEREAGRVFKDWKEGKISFAPTYKYSFNSNTYFAETHTSKNKRRTPAWCDRILWHGNGIRQLSYIRKDSKEFLFSDHRPVCTSFLIDVFLMEGSRRGLANSNMKVEIEELLPATRDLTLINHRFEVGELQKM
ncbi:hypothetical protein V2J09_008206 [Rumex salicifolius]